MTFINKQEKILREIIEQSRGRFTRFSSGQMARIVFDPVTIAQLLHHLEVKIGALLDPLGLNPFLGISKVFDALFELFFYGFDGIIQGDP